MNRDWISHTWYISRPVVLEIVIIMHCIWVIIKEMLAEFLRILQNWGFINCDHYIPGVCGNGKERYDMRIENTKKNNLKKTGVNISRRGYTGGLISHVKISATSAHTYSWRCSRDESSISALTNGASLWAAGGSWWVLTNSFDFYHF